MAARSGIRIHILRAIMEAPGGMNRQQLRIALPNLKERQFKNATNYLAIRGDIRCVNGLWMATAKADASVRPNKEPPKLDGSLLPFGVSARTKKVLVDPSAKADASHAKITRDSRQWPTAAWQLLPSQPPIGFSKLPLGATLSGWTV